MNPRLPAPSTSALISGPVQNGVTVDFGLFLTDIGLQRIIVDVLDAKPVTLLPGSRFAVTSVRNEGEWWLISVASLNGPECSSDVVGSSECAGLILASVDRALGRRAALAGTQPFLDYLARVPNSFIAPEAKAYLDPNGVTALRTAASSVEYKFPWPPGEREYWNGWFHDDGKSLDIGTSSSDSDRRILSSASGVITFICRGSLSANVNVKDASGTTLQYYHFDISQLGPDIAEGMEVERGQLLGVLRPGRWDLDGCGRSEQTLSSAHLHWVLPTDRAFSADGWTIQHPDSTWRNAGQTRIPTFPYQPLPSTNYILVPQIKYFDTVVSTPAGWPYLINSSDNRIRKISIDDSFGFWPEQAGCNAIWYNASKGSHRIKFWYELRDAGTPTVDIYPWPLNNLILPPACAAEPTNPPNDTQPIKNDGALFISDISFPDGSIISPNQALIKTWRVKNTGTTTWGNSYQLVFREGNLLGAPITVSVPSASPGQEVNLSVSLQVPSDATSGTYTARWQLRNAQGTYFGDIIWLSLVVPGSQPPSGNSVNVNLRGVNSPTSVSPGQRFQPQITVHVSGGQLLQSRGDMLRNTDGNLYGAWPHVAVVGTADSGQDYTFTFYADNPIIAPSSNGTYQSKWQVWANNGWVGPEITIRFSVYQASSNHPPNKPSLVSPSNWAVLVGQQPTLCAQNNGDPDGDAITGYRFEIFESAQTYNSGWVTSSCVTPSGMGNYGYQWHAQVRDSGGAVSEWSDSRYFNIESSSVSITDFHFIPGSPSNTNPVIIWVETSGCGGVNVGGDTYVNTASDGTSSGTWKGISSIAGPKTTMQDAPRWDILEYTEGDHLVRVDMHSCDGSHTIQDQHYTLLRAQPSRPYLQAPSNGFWSNSRTITFRWKQSLRDNDYTLRIATTQAALDTSPLLKVDLTATEYTYTFNQDYPQLYWRVSANNEVGTSTEGDWWVGIDRTPSTSSISTSRTPALSYDSQFAISWDGSDTASDVQSYDVQVRQGTNGTWTDWLTGYVYQSALFMGQPGNTYCFRTSAHDIAGNTESPHATADACVRVDPTQRPPQVWWNSSYLTKRALVVVNRMAGSVLPAGYPVQLHFDSSTSPTAAEIYNASQAASKGDDVRVVFSDTTEVARHIINFSSSAVDIWFATQADIAANGSSSAYALYYRNAIPGTPPSTLTQIYQPDNDSQTLSLWYFEEAGSSSVDSSGHSNSITWVGDPTRDQSSGLHGNGVKLNGSQWGTTNSISSDHMTIETWVWFDSLTNGNQDWNGVFGAYDSTENRTRWDVSLVGTSDPHLRSSISIINSDGGRNDIDYTWETTSIQTGRWYHVAVTYDGITVKFWFDGILRSQHIQIGRVDNRYQTLYIGRSIMSNPPMIGRLDGFRISSEARSDFPYARIDARPTAGAGQELGHESIGSTDLALQGLATMLNSDGNLLVQATLKNQGTSQTYNEFLIHLYGDRTPTGPGDLNGSIGFWVNAPVVPGATITLTTVLTQGAMTGMTRASVAADERTVNLAVQADSTGVVSDSNRANNILTGTQICLAAADVYEPNNTPQQAHSIGIAESQHHNVNKPGDQDWVSFTAPGGVTFTLSTSGLGAAADTFLYLYDTDSTTLLASNDDYGDSLASQIRWSVPTTRTLYALVRHWNPSTGGCGTSYDLTLTRDVHYLYLPVVGSTSSSNTIVKIGLWAATSTIPEPSAAPFNSRGMQLVSHNSYVYVFGGRGATDLRLTSVYYSAVNTNGSLGAWHSTTSIPGQYYDHVEVIVGNYIYLVTGAASATDVYYAPIHSDGTLGVWTSTMPLSPSRQSFAAVAYGNHIYSIGGNSGGARDFVKFTTVNANGSLGTWVDTTPLPVPVENHTAVAYDGRLYVLVPAGMVYVASINSDGTLGNWNAVASMPQVTTGFSSFEHNGYLYLLGGGTLSYYVALFDNGTLGQWQSTTPLPESRYCLRAGTSDSFIYALGGYDGINYRDTAYYAAFVP